MDGQQHGDQLKRGLKNRHIQLIALGGAIGTGLFLGIAQTIKMAGPSVILGYAIGGFIAFLIMRQLGEMVVEEPVAGSFSHFAYKYWGNFAGFASGWNYWVLYVLVAMAELTAVGIYVQYWWPEIPTWVSAAVFFLAINAINLANVKVYGEMEFWFAIIKVVAIIGMIVFGAYLLFSGMGGPEATVTNLWAQGGFFPNGIMGLVMAMAVIMFSFGGLELVGITAAEADNPQKSIPKATNQVIYRILLFYIGSLAILLSLYPWGKVVEGGSPFVLIFHALNSNLVATVLNVVVLTAALSVYNSCVYCNSRMLYGLAKQGNGPKSLLKVDGRGVPVIAIAVSATATAFCVLINYLIPGRAFELLMALVVSALVINWAMISLAHLKFRAAKNREGVEPKFKAFWYPFSNYLCLVFMAGILVIMYLTPGIQISVLLIPVWVAVLAIGYAVKQRSQRAVSATNRG
ncbi:Aromatic amino acid transport protein AroP [Serratia grimesii]|jgi:aromatic amino acid transport protein AroP|uniref:Aromatic amino acid transport protein AroP n=1 Tax=Serratia grimesii TaxID=82995 RepID=A0A7G2JTV1_9GAMM|nr:amino acid permease [Serratia grimesii]KFB90155.1 aromatic amino acid transporter [Serratia grimesii]CAI0978511.1 General aromatic amino acid permease [Serratia grimesii]CAI1021998.1 General aromatic amino acid permease [Serratia grimesii]CAI1157564.1 General aromatic amino acid permease [Serratia grimesii]CAI1735333.1 General aromatic amino acid permease [Serratia grimesii]